MQPLSNEDIKNLAQELNPFIGARLQEVRLLGGCLCLGFYLEDFFWWVVDTNNKAPQFVQLSDLKAIPYKENKKPLSLFLHAHFCDDRLSDVEPVLEYGRVLKLHFMKGGVIEMRLFPRGANIIVRSGKTEVSLFKPQDLRPLASLENNGQRPYIPLEETSRTWLESFAKTKSDKNVGEKDQQKKINQMSKALTKAEQDLLDKQNQLWGEAGEWLKANQNLSAPDEFKKFLDLKKSFSWNLENCFRRAKDMKQKIIGSEKRRTQLQAELKLLELGLATKNFSSAKSGGEPPLRPAILDAAQARGRTFDISANVFLFVGRSAEDNLRLLRESKPWYLWIHLRDYPGSHGIIHRQKNKDISDAELHQAVNCLLLHQFKDKAQRHSGDKFQFLVAECRYIRPIKGDRVGRVNYSNERTLLHVFTAQKKS